MHQTCFSVDHVNLLRNVEIFTDLDAKEKFDFQDNSYTLADELFTYAKSNVQQAYVHQLVIIYVV